MSNQVESNTWDQMSQQLNSHSLSPNVNNSISNTPQRSTPNPRERDAAFAREQQIAVKETARRYEENIRNSRPKENGYKVTEPEDRGQRNEERKTFEKRIPLVWFVLADVQTFPVDGHLQKVVFPSLIKSGKTGPFTVGYGGGNKIYEIDDVILKLLEYIFTTTTFSNVKALGILAAGIAKTSAILDGTLTSLSIEQVEALLSFYILRGACALLQMRQIAYKIDFGNLRTFKDKSGIERKSDLTPEMESNMNILKKFAANGVMAYFALYNSFLFPSLAHASPKNLDVYLSSLDCEITDRIKIREFVYGRVMKYATKRLFKQYNTVELIDTDSLEASNQTIR